MGIQLSEHFVSKGKYFPMQDGPAMINSGAVSPLIQRVIQSLKSASNFDTFLLNQLRKKSQKRRNSLRENAIMEKGSKKRERIGVEVLDQKHAIATEKMILYSLIINPSPSFISLFFAFLHLFYASYVISALILMHFKLAYYN